MASKFLRRQKWWIKFRHPATGETIRESLETGSEARAELLRERLELQVALLDPRFQAVEIPARLRPTFTRAAEPRSESSPTAVVAAGPLQQVSPPARRCSVNEAAAAYLRFIASENVALHIANKVSMLRRFIGAERVEKAGGPPRIKRRRPKNGEIILDPPPVFTGEYLDEITPISVQGFIENLPVVTKTKRHYREFFHHFFEFCLKFGLYHPANWHCPNPVAALPSYLARNRTISFLTQEQIDEQITALAEDPPVQMAVLIMIHGGLRRAETVWLSRNSLAPDLSYLSVLNRRDEDDIESSLKTGERAVTILPPLRAALEKYLCISNGPWLVANSGTKRWTGDFFAKRLRKLNRGHGLKWTALSYRHTYATQRAAEGWSLFRIAKEMGNSVAIVEQYYAGYIRPGSVVGN